MNVLTACLACLVVGAPPTSDAHSQRKPDHFLVKVMDANGNALQGANVDILDEREKPLASSTTGPQGFAEFSGLDPREHGNVWVRASRGGLTVKNTQVAWALPFTELFLGVPTQLHAISPAPESALCKIYVAPCCSHRCCCYVAQPPCSPCDLAPICRDAVWLTDGTSSSDSGEAKLTVSVPPDAQVFINGRATKSAGDHRSFVSGGLAYGYGYEYVVQARIVRDGKTIDDSRTVILRPGDWKAVGLHISETARLAAQRPTSPNTEQSVRRPPPAPRPDRPNPKELHNPRERS
jgi:uncharacterized protein (TIGR03000 family)